MKKILALALLLGLATQAGAQTFPLNNLPLGKGPGKQGWTALAPGSAGTCLAISGGVPTFVSCSTGIIPFTQPTSYPPTVSSGHVVPYLDSDAQFGNQWSQYPLGIVSTNPLTLGRSGNSIGSSTVGQIFRLNFTSAGLTGSPIAISYTAIGGDTTSIIATNLCANVNANATLHGLGGKPLFCQALGANFNLQYDSPFVAAGATPVTITNAGSTGTVNLAAEIATLDYIVVQCGRNAPGRAALASDGLCALDFTGQNSTGTFQEHYGQITTSIFDPTAGNVRGNMTFLTPGAGSSLIGRMNIREGVYLYNSSGVGATGTDKGPGSVNITDQYYVNGVAVASGSAWTAFTPTPTCGTATITSTSARAKVLGKTTFLEGDFTITVIGTCAVTNITFNLPNTAQSSGALIGREIVNSNKGINCTIIATNTTATCLKSDATAWAVNDRLLFSGVYENQ